MNSSTITYEPVDCEGLATTLAVDAWEEEVKARGLTRDQLYETVVTEKGMVTQVRAEWAYDFFDLRDRYMALISEHKPVEDEACKESR